MPLSNFLVDCLRNWYILIYRLRNYVVIIFGGTQFLKQWCDIFTTTTLKLRINVTEISSRINPTHVGYL